MHHDTYAFSISIPSYGLHCCASHRENFGPIVGTVSSTFSRKILAVRFAIGFTLTPHSSSSLHHTHRRNGLIDLHFHSSQDRTSREDDERSILFCTDRLALRTVIEASQYSELRAILGTPYMYAKASIFILSALRGPQHATLPDYPSACRRRSLRRRRRRCLHRLPRPATGTATAGGARDDPHPKPVDRHGRSPDRSRRGCFCWARWCMPFSVV